MLIQLPLTHIVEAIVSSFASALIPTRGIKKGSAPSVQAPIAERDLEKRAHGWLSLCERQVKKARRCAEF